MPQNKQQSQHPKTTKIKIIQSLQTISKIKQAHREDSTSAGCCSSPAQQQTQQLQNRPRSSLMMAQVQQRHKQHNRNPRPASPSDLVKPIKTHFFASLTAKIDRSHAGVVAHDAVNGILHLLAYFLAHSRRFFSHAPVFFCSILFDLNARCSAAAQSRHARGGRSSRRRRQQQQWRRRRSRGETNGQSCRFQAFASTFRTEKGFEKLTWRGLPFVCVW
jgi:hypothetical protein